MAYVMRVQDRTSLGPAAAETGRTPETQKSGRDSTGRSGAVGSADGDRVELSSTLGRLSQAIATHTTQRAQRVQALAAEYQSGRYRPNSAATSRGLISEALSAERR